MNDSVLFIKSPPSLFSGFPHGFDEMTPINRKIEHCKTDLFYLRFLQIINVIIKHILVYHNSGEMSIFPKRIFYFKKQQNPQAVYGKIPKKHAIAFMPSRFQDFTFFALSGIRQSRIFCPMGEMAGEDKSVKVVDFTVAVYVRSGKPKRQTASEFFPYYHLALYYRQKEP